MAHLSFESLVNRTDAALDSDFFVAAPAWAKRTLEEFWQGQYVVRDANHRYNIVRALTEVSQTNKRLARTAGDGFVRRTHTTGKTARNKAKHSYNCPCVTKEGKPSGCSSKRDHDVMIRTKMRSSKGK